MELLDYATFFSYIALNVDVVLQIRKIYRTKSSADLSLAGMTIRYIAILIILTKFISLEDKALVVGQGLIAVTFTTYFFLAVTYFRRRKIS